MSVTSIYYFTERERKNKPHQTTNKQLEEPQTAGWASSLLEPGSGSGLAGRRPLPAACWGRRFPLAARSVSATLRNVSWEGTETSRRSHFSACCLCFWSPGAELGRRQSRAPRPPAPSVAPRSHRSPAARWNTAAQCGASQSFAPPGGSGKLRPRVRC